MILNALEGKKLPVYGDGMNVRDWLYVEDHCRAIFSIMKAGRTGETYNIGGENEQPNIRIVNRVCEVLEELYPLKENTFIRDLGQGIGSYKELITYVKDRPGHDRRYAINCDKLKRELGWKPGISFEEGIRETVRWYLDHPQWINRVTSGAYQRERLGLLREAA